MNITTAKVVKVTAHPNASKLKVCEVFDGKNQVVVVCGASNVTENMVTILAHVGATTPTGLSIKASDLRGVVSNGMLCSTKDLNLNNEGGIVDLPPQTKLGVDWNQLDKKSLSSTPWYQYQLVETLWETKNKKIFITREKSEEETLIKTHPEAKTLSFTYFHQGEYLYRHS